MEKINFEEKKLLSLFSGCGGLDLGFEGDFSVYKESVNLNINKHWSVKNIDDYWLKLPKTVFKTVFANDIREDAKVVWDNYFFKKYNMSSVYHLSSIVDVVKSYKYNNINVFPQGISIVTGGFPCQDFSLAGKRKGFSSHKAHDNSIITDDNPTVENRGQLYMWLREVVEITQPKVFIAENVKGLVNLHNVKEIIERDFSSICDGGYLILPAVLLHAANYGIPQNRERVIFYGFKKSELNAKTLNEFSKEVISEEYSPYPIQTHSSKISKSKNHKPFVTVREAFLNLSEPDVSNDIEQTKYSKAKFMGKHCQGQSEVDLNSIAPTIRSEHHGNIEFRRLSKQNNGKYHDELKHGLRERRLTIRECARLQTFPDDYNFILPACEGNKSVSASSAYKLIGNAVPPLLGFHIAKRLEDNWDKYFK